MRICVVGKGGAGKSMVAGTIARTVARRGERVLALDADPMPGMARSLGTADTTEPLLADAVDFAGDAANYGCRSARWRWVPCGNRERR